MTKTNSNSFDVLWDMDFQTSGNPAAMSLYIIGHICFRRQEHLRLPI